MKKILTVIGARPQFVKAAVVSHAIARRQDAIREVVVHTGQHYDAAMSDVFFSELEMSPPRHNLGVGSGPHGAQTGEIMRRLEEVVVDEQPDVILIYGDTNSTLAAALVGAKACIPVAHVEAGLRSFNRQMPEEINRIVADRLSAVLFAPTRTAVANLDREGISEGVFNTGDVMYDAALQYAAKAAGESRILERLNLAAGGYMLATVHRAENTDDRQRLQNILSALQHAAGQLAVVLPIHPRTRKMIAQHALQDLLKGVTVIDPVGFIDMTRLQSNARLIATDSGGVQKEAYFHHIPCVTLRTETEWVETVTAGWNTLADPRSFEELRDQLNTGLSSDKSQTEITDYGSGHASEQIVTIIARHLGFSDQ